MAIESEKMSDTSGAPTPEDCRTLFPHQNGGAMVELVFLMMAAAGVIHLMLHWNWMFSHKESYWAGAAFDAHAVVNHEACLEKVATKKGNKVAIVGIQNNEKEKICDGL